MKSRDEKLREEIVGADPDEAYQSLVDYREEQAAVLTETITLRTEKRRAGITPAKMPMLLAVSQIIGDRGQQGLLPISVRKIHYLLPIESWIENDRKWSRVSIARTPSPARSSTSTPNKTCRR